MKRLLMKLLEFLEAISMPPFSSQFETTEQELIREFERDFHIRLQSRFYF
jgi:hypothetical protein